MTTGLARVTISAPQRRVDVALPEQVPLAELLPDVLRHAGEGLADDGERHGGWVLRRTDGALLATAQALLPQGVRDGEVLHLVPARAHWPELEYDDVVEAIAEGARRRGGAWSPAPPARPAWCRPARTGPSWSTTTWSRRSPKAPVAVAAPGR
ncbi:EsaB/YukD family protein, partial [Micromonospora parastrephiae]|uniref:EsaB/YukD family protein n=1 Tax=Micromonospora parastrephiae TaxID=2806101 RepID=UPI001EE41051